MTGSQASLPHRVAGDVVREETSNPSRQPTTHQKGEDTQMTATLRDTASVVCNTTVDGGRRRKPRTERRSRSGPVETLRVRKDVMRAAHGALRPGERIEIVSPTRVDIVTDRRH